MADSAVEHIRRSTQAEVPQLMVDLGDGTFAAAVAIPASAGSIGPELVVANAVVTLTNADTQYTVSVPACQGFEFMARTAAAVRFAFATGKVATPTDPYRTLPAGCAYTAEGNFPAFTLYLASSSTGTVVEVGYKA